MPALRQSLKRPQTWLAVIALCVLAASVDSFRDPRRQVTAQAYVGLVRVYQRYGRPLTNRFARCRYLPTCSEYSIEAVRLNGIRRGLLMTLRRIARCRSEVPLGTFDPPPAQAG